MFCFDIYLNQTRVGYLEWQKGLDRASSTCVQGMNPDEDCLQSFTLRYMLEHLQISEFYPCAILHNITVDSEFRRKGYGSAMLAEFENQAIDESCHFAFCAIGYDDETEMRANIEFYKRNGYKLFCHDHGMHYTELYDNETYWSLAFKELNFNKHADNFLGLSYIK